MTRLEALSRLTRVYHAWKRRLPPDALPFGIFTNLCYYSDGFTLQNDYDRIEIIPYHGAGGGGEPLLFIRFYEFVQTQIID